MPRRALLVGAAATLAAPAARAGEKKLRVGLIGDTEDQLTDAVVAAGLAVADAGGRAGPPAVEIVPADRGGPAAARHWLAADDIEIIIDLADAGVADIVRERNKVLLGAGTADLTGPRCSPNTVQWGTGNWALGHALGRSVPASGGRNWFFLTADDAQGSELQAHMEQAVREAGGLVAGAARHPAGTANFAALLLQARASGATMLALANAAPDTATALRQASEFGLTPRMGVAAPNAGLDMIATLGLKQAAGVRIATAFYWDTDDATRGFARRFAAAHPRHAMPDEAAAGVHAALAHCLKATAALGTATDGRAVVAAMKRLPGDDRLFGAGTIRADGRKLHPLHLMETKAPGDSTGKWDLFRRIETIPQEEAFRPLADATCKLLG